MGESDNVKCAECGSSFNRMFLMGKQGNANVCPMCGGKLTGEEEHPDWITWYYYQYIGTNSCILRDNPADLEKRIDLKLIQEFKAPPEAECGLDEVKRILRTYVPDAFLETPKPEICCPLCGSTEFTILNRGYSVWTGFLGSGKVKRVCNRCKREF